MIKWGIIIIPRGGFPAPLQWYRPGSVPADLKKCDQQLENFDLSRSNRMIKLGIIIRGGLPDYYKCFRSDCIRSYVHMMFDISEV